MSDLRGMTEALPENIDVVASGGVFDGTYRTEADITTNQYLTGPTFLSTCSIPDIKPNTKVIGICGISDWNAKNDPSLPGTADPHKDGWFFSDFYLFHHLLKDVSSDQIWLTCVSPEIAVKKYTEYVHGDSAPGKVGSRKVVLNKAMLNDLGDVRTIAPNDLLERVLSTIRQVCQDATDQGRPLLILIFAHGEEETHALQIGGRGNLLTMNLFKRAIGSRTPSSGLCLLTTACYSGGWAINPALNITSLTAQANWIESLAWPVSGTARARSCGSPFASAIAETLLKLTIDGFGTEEFQDYDRAPTYAGFIHIVQNTVQRLDTRKLTIDGTTGSGYSAQQPMFSAQDDAWEMEYSKRTGLPLNVFQARWLQLKAAGPRQPPPGDEHQFGLGGHVFSYDQLTATVKREGQAYFNCFPGLDNKSKNLALHNSLRLLLDREDEKPHISELAYMRDQIDYRLNQVMGAATVYKNFLEVSIADCHKIDMDEYQHRGSPRFISAVLLVRQYPLFDKPSILQGHQYAKGDEYLAACIIEAGWSRAQAETKLDSLVKYRGIIFPPLSSFTERLADKDLDAKVLGSGVSNVDGASRIMNTINRYQLQRDRTIRDSIRAIAQSTRRRLRSLSPNKSRRRALPSEWTQDNSIPSLGGV